MIARQLAVLMIVCGAFCMIVPPLRARFGWRFIAVGLLVAFAAGLFR